MPSTRVLRGIVSNALESYLSRYSSYQGYWLFGFLIETLDEVEFDLLAPQGPSGTPLEAAQARAVRVFREQLAKSGLAPSLVENARLGLRRGRVANVDTESFSAWGWELQAHLVAQSSRGHAFQARRAIRVAAHNPCVERRSAGAA